MLFPYSGGKRFEAQNEQIFKVGEIRVWEDLKPPVGQLVGVLAIWKIFDFLGWSIKNNLKILYNK